MATGLGKTTGPRTSFGRAVLGYTKVDEKGATLSLFISTRYDIWSLSEPPLRIRESHARMRPGF